ncbi:uncharacterized protein PADG_11563 [Paracoccidioides brasiliensis Pb18]|uniref:Uncharacterized protein n=1 Tax=Paracoccidioides brasiliensis (strain Pb18) TaxID=502780 RepID=A0A0A0HT38_PARBD|nr:uncharacterized protein PADG_11563 [Paracoccidioides brasiliensis Pb18]KGM92364.1 hypothetical protein PADG_11563 [Paracoccidioides brasiliensis Pb18]
MEHLDVMRENPAPSYGSCDHPYSARREPHRVAISHASYPRSSSLARRIPSKTILEQPSQHPLEAMKPSLFKNQRVKAKDPRSGGARSKRTRELIVTPFEL